LDGYKIMQKNILIPKVLPDRRIKIVEKVTGKKEYYPQKKKSNSWEDCLVLAWGYSFFDTRKEALRFLEKEHNEGDKSIHYEYFN